MASNPNSNSAANRPAAVSNPSANRNSAVVAAISANPNSAVVAAISANPNSAVVANPVGNRNSAADPSLNRNSSASVADRSTNRNSAVGVAPFTASSSQNPNCNFASPYPRLNPNLSTAAKVLWNSLAGPNHIPQIGHYAYFFPEGEFEQYGLKYEPEGNPNSRTLVKVLDAERSYLGNTHIPIVNYRLQQVNQLFKTSKWPIKPEETVVSWMKTLGSLESEGFNLVIPDEFARTVFGVRKTQATKLLKMEGLLRNWDIVLESSGSYRHRLSDGWTSFVQENELVQGDRVLFVRSMVSDQIYIGFRKELPDLGEPKINTQVEVNAESFTTVHFPTRSLCFVVQSCYVNGYAVSGYSEGTRVAMRVQSEKGAEFALGYIHRVRKCKTGGWTASPWKMFEVSWFYKPREASDLPQFVSPWDVQAYPPIQFYGPVFPQLPQHLSGRQADIKLDANDKNDVVVAEGGDDLGARGTKRLRAEGDDDLGARVTKPQAEKELDTEHKDDEVVSRGGGRAEGDDDLGARGTKPQADKDDEAVSSGGGTVRIFGVNFPKEAPRAE